MSTPFSTPAVQESRRPGFLRRAVIEAQRYGEDPWVFVRELLQNARDAGATRVTLELEERAGLTRLRCTDNGHGMAFADARAYLFSLYSSSKEKQGNQAGRFGVGFWSILRFEPETIIIRSRPHQGKAELGWGVKFDGTLQKARKMAPATEVGTQIILERPQRDGNDAKRLLDAASQNGRFLMQRDHPQKAMEITVNGVSIARPFSLPAPCIQFRAEGIRGVVALGQRPGVELFSRGLRVRAAANLEDLLSSAHVATHSRVRFHELSDALAPRALLDCENLDLLLYRSDVRDDTSLRKLIRLAQRHLRQLVEEQLALVHPPSLWERIESLWYRILDFPHLRRVAGWSAAAVSLLILIGASGYMLQNQVTQIEYTVPVAAPNAPFATPQKAEHLPHLRVAYRGPSVQTLDEGSSPSLDVSYSPPDDTLYLRQFSVSDLRSGQPSTPRIRLRYQGQSCKKNQSCIEVEIPVRSRSAENGQRHWISLPEATGYRVNPKSIQLIYNSFAQGPSPSFRLLSDGAREPWLSLNSPFYGRIRYQMAPAAAPRDPQARIRIKHPAIEKWSQDIAKGQNKRDPKLIAKLERSVADRIVYSTTAKTADRHQTAIANQRPLIERALEIGAGDCDVQNSLLAMLLRSLGYSARLAVGYIGQHGELIDTLHAWVEYRKNRSEPWQVLDASTVYELPPAFEDAEAKEPFASPSSDYDLQNPPATQNKSWLPRSFSSLLALVNDYSWYWMGASILLLLSGLALRFKSPPSNRIRLANAQHLPAIVQGALRQPESFYQLPGLFRRRLLPAHDGRMYSLSQAESAATEGRLHTAKDNHALTQHAVGLGDIVLDQNAAVSKIVADTLGAHDLEPWQALFASSQTPAILDELNHLFAQYGFPLWVGLSSDLEQGIAVASFGREMLDLPRWRSFITPTSASALHRARQLIFISKHDPQWRHIQDICAQRPQAARFEIFQWIQSHLKVDESLVQALQSHLATQALVAKRPQRDPEARA